MEVTPTPNGDSVSDGFSVTTPTLTPSVSVGVVTPPLFSGSVTIADRMSVESFQIRSGNGSGAASAAVACDNPIEYWQG